MRTIFFRLPRLAILTMMVILIGGIGAMFSLGRQEDPTLIERYGFILTTLPGADAERMEALVTQPIEAALMELPEVDEIQSVSRPGVSQVSLQVREDLTEAEVDDAWTLIRQKVAFAESQFPAGTNTPEIHRQYVGAATLVVGLVWEGEGDPPLAVMRRMALDLQDRFQRLPGTELTDLFGVPAEEIRIVVDPEALSAAGLTVRQAASLVASADSKTPAGRLRSDGGNVGLEVGGEFENISRIRSVPLVQRPDGSEVRVSDVATVQKGFEDPPVRMALENGKRSIFVGLIIFIG